MGQLLLSKDIRTKFDPFFPTTLSSSREERCSHPTRQRWSKKDYRKAWKRKICSQQSDPAAAFGFPGVGKLGQRSEGAQVGP